MTSTSTGITQSGATRFTFIDGLRGFAAFWVMAYHIFRALGEGRVGWPSAIGSFLSHGDRGVQIFFVLSGFVIAYSIHGQRVNARFAGNFALRRSLRLDPAYWTMIGLMTVAMVAEKRLGALTAKPAPGVTDVLVNAAYLNGLLGRPSIVIVGWTLAYEIQFYLAYLLLTWLAQGFSARLRSDGLGRLIAFGPLALYALLVQFEIVPPVKPGLAVGSWIMFFLGVVTWWALSGKGTSRWFVVTAGAISAALIAKFNPSAAVALATGIAIFVCGRLQALRSWLNVRPVQYLGRISYSLYLAHSLAVAIGAYVMIDRLHLPVTGARAILPFALLTAVSLLAAHAFFVIVERPSHRLSKRFRPAARPAGHLISAD